MSKELYHWYKDHGICVKCGYEKAEKNHSMSLVCMMEQRERNKADYQKRKTTQTPEQAEKESAIRKKRYYRLKAQGICTKCGKRPENTEKGITQCERCAAKRRNQQAAKRLEQQCIPYQLRVCGEFWYLCCEPIPRGKYKLCPECYAKSCEALKKARENVEENYFSKANAAFWGE